MTNKQKLYSIALVSAAMILMLLSTAGAAPFAYITNINDNTVSVIDTATNNITATVTVGSYPFGVAATGSNVYVTNYYSGTVSVINTTTNSVTATVDGVGGLGVTVSPDGSNIYVANTGFSLNGGSVAVINTTTNSITATMNGFFFPSGIAITPDRKKVYVANYANGNVSVIDTATNNITANVTVGGIPWGVAIAPDGSNVYVANRGWDIVSVINTTNNSIIATVNGLNSPYGIAVSPDGSTLYVTNYGSTTVSVINTTTNRIAATVDVGLAPMGVAVTPDGKKVYVANLQNNNVSVINTTTNNVTDTVNVGKGPAAFGQFIGKPAPAITWSTPADIIYGTPLNDTQLDATALDPISGNPVDGTFIYTPSSGTVLNAGQQQAMSTIFIPNDSVNYTKAYATALINVTKATPTITWSDPNNINYGTALNSTQLNASASVPGTFVYIPSSGTVLNAGLQTLNVLFIPTDLMDYNINTILTTVLINVTPLESNREYPGLQICCQKLTSLCCSPYCNVVEQNIKNTYNINNKGDLQIKTDMNS